ncbi:MAG: PAS domain S-box protein, partial [Proteobacteria bacterium]|nr:PAS domain S-box protein [Pseudomonadota bacterium]
MIWQSIFLMTVVDVLILGIVGYSAAVFLMSQKRQAARGSQIGFFAIFGGLSLVALFYLADLLVMHAVPRFMPRAEAMAIMRELHLNGSWLVALLGIGTICFGFTSVNRATAALVGDLEARERDLDGELTERKRIEQSLRESEARFEDFARLGSDWSWELDDQFRFMFDSGELAVSGLGGAEVIGKAHWELPGVESETEAWRQHRADLQAHKPIRNFQFSYRNRQGTLRTVSISGKPIFDAEDRFVGYRGASHDITESKRAEEALTLTQFAVERSADAVFWVAPDGRILNVNEAACRHLGYSREELVSMTTSDINPAFSQEKWPEYWKEIKQAGSLTFESTQIHKDGREIPVEISTNFLEFNGKEYDFAFVRAISERKELEKEALRHREELANAHRVASLGELAGSIAHEINQPLTAIVTNAQASRRFLAKDSPNLDELSDALTEIAESDPQVVAVLVEPVLGEGGIMVNKDGYRYLQDYDLGTPLDVTDPAHPVKKSMELGPRDRLSQAFV